MILVCVGASEYPFNRLIRMLDQLCEKGVLNGKEIIAQVGNATYSPKHYTFFPLIAREEFQKYLAQADLIITHAGTGSVIPPLKLDKKVIIVPRKSKYKEHIDDHQQELVDVFVTKGFAMTADTEEELQSCIENLDNFIPRKFVSNNKVLCNMILDFIENN